MTRRNPTPRRDEEHDIIGHRPKPRPETEALPLFDPPAPEAPPAPAPEGQ